MLVKWVCMTHGHIGGSATAIRVAMVRTWSMFYSKVKLLEFGQPTCQHALYVLEVCEPQQRSVVSPNTKVASPNISFEMVQCGHHSQQFAFGCAIFLLCWIQAFTIVCNHIFCSVNVLGQHAADTVITSISVDVVGSSPLPSGTLAPVP